MIEDFAQPDAGTVDTSGTSDDSPTTMSILPAPRSFAPLIVPALLLLSGACRDRQTPPPPTNGTGTGKGTDAGLAAAPTDAPSPDAGTPVSRWKYADMREEFLRDCPLTLPVAKKPLVGHRTQSLDYRSCRLQVSRATVRNQLVELMEPNERDGTWHMYRAQGDDDAGGYVHTFSIDYTTAGEKPARECSRIGVDAARYARAVMSLSDVETIRVAGTFQHLVASRFSGYAARVTIRDEQVLLVASVGTRLGETWCEAGLESHAMTEEAIAGIVDIPLSPAPPATTAPTDAAPSSKGD